MRRGPVSMRTVTEPGLAPGGATGAAAGAATAGALVTVKVNFPLLGCPSAAAVRHTTVYRPTLNGVVTAVPMPVGSASDAGAASGIERPAESRS